MTAQRHHALSHFKDSNPVGRMILARHVAANGRKFPSPWPRRLCVLMALAAAGVAVGLASGVVL